MRMRRYHTKAMSMIEMMVTTVIIGICLVIALRTFTVCASIISYASNSMVAVDILEKKLAKLKESAIINNGVEASSVTENIVKGNREFEYAQTISRWKRATSSKGAEAQERESDQAHTALCEVGIGVRWKSARKEDTVSLKMYMPAKESRS